MRIKNISVKGLFNVFDHDIQFNLEDRITIIHGPNGFGKTTLLRMINALFNARYQELRSIIFKELRIDFDDKSNLRITKGKINDIEITYKKTGQTYDPFAPFSSKMIEQLRLPYGLLEDVVQGLERIDPITWHYFGEILSTEDVIERFANYPHVDRYLERFADEKSFRQKKEPVWLRDIRQKLPIRFIQTQRLLSISNSRGESGLYKKQPSMRLSVEGYSKELVGTIQSKLAEYAELSQSLDRSFPARLVTEANARSSKDDISQKLLQLEKKRARLMEVGLLDKDNKDFEIPAQNTDPTTRKILSVYVSDVEKKLSIFDDFADKIDLLKKIINQRFLYKQMGINRNEGFVLETEGSTPLSSASLSAGEQHELVLLYELLFKTAPGALLLIDEPEISLHVGWQLEFLKDLQEITRLSSIDVLIATHSPQIINDRWDLTVELKGNRA
jgi:predicted ATP-binding protein involved in virulence